MAGSARLAAVAAAAAILGFAPHAGAQDIYGVDYYSSMQQTTIDNMLYLGTTTVGTSSICAAYGGCEEADARVEAARARIGGLDIDAAGAVIADTTYTRSPEITEQVIDSIYREMRRANPAGAEHFLSVARSQDVIAYWDELVREDGLATGDIADALAGFWGVAWMMINGMGPDDPDQPRRAELVPVRDQLRRALAASPDVAAMSEAERQELAETFIVNALIAGSDLITLSAPGQEDELRRYSDRLHAHMQSLYGIDFRALIFTEDGLRPRG
jgi:hypothetical protein